MWFNGSRVFWPNPWHISSINKPPLFIKWRPKVPATNCDSRHLWSGYLNSQSSPSSPTSRLHCTDTDTIIVSCRFPKPLLIYWIGLYFPLLRLFPWLDTIRAPLKVMGFSSFCVEAYSISCALSCLYGAKGTRPEKSISRSLVRTCISPCLPQIHH